MDLDDHRELLERITVNLGKHSDKPAVRDTAVLVENVLDMLVAGRTAEDILADNPAMESEDIRACLVYAYGSVAYDNVQEYVSASPHLK